MARLDLGMERIKLEVYIDSSRAATWELNLGGLPLIAMEDRELFSVHAPVFVLQLTKGPVNRVHTQIEFLVK